MENGKIPFLCRELLVDVPVTTIDALIQEFGLPKVCKIDAEGFEYEVLQGLSCPISFIAFEFTREFINDAMLCIEYLGSLGSADFKSTVRWDIFSTVFILNWTDSNTLFESIERNTDDLLWGDIYVRFHF